MTVMNERTEGTISAMAAMLVLFTAMLDPRVSVGLAVLSLIGLSIYHFRPKQK